MSEDEAPGSSKPGASRRWRALVLALLLGVALVGWHFGVLDQLTVENLRRWAESAGWWGPPVFVALFAVGEIFHVPSVIFVVVAGIVWPLGVALPTAYIGGMVASATVFLVARFLVGDGVRKLVHDKMPPELKRYDKALEHKGVRTVALIRLVAFMAPAMHWVLATSRVGFGTMMIGTAIGLAPGISALVILGERAVRYWDLVQPWFFGAIGVAVVVQGVRIVLRRRRAQAEDPAPGAP